MLAGAYPLDGYEKTGIGRVEAQRLVQIGEKPGKKRPSGELLPLEMVDLRLLEHREMELPEPDPKLTARLKKLLGPEADRYGMTLLDLSDLENPRYAEWNGHQRQNPGSVGKIMVALAIFQALADIYPDDIAARENVLRTSMITADIFSVSDHHSVPFWNPETRTVSKRPIKQGDTASLWTYLDWMMSPSSNSAAAMNEKTLVSITHFGKRYPVSPEEEQKFFDDTPKKQLSEIFLKAIQDPVTRNGMDIEAAAPGQLLHPPGQEADPGHEQLRDAARAGQLHAETRTGQARRRVVEPRNQAADVHHRAAHPLRIVRRVAAVRGLFQIRLALQLRTRRGLRVQEIPRQQAQLHELRGDHRNTRRDRIASSTPSPCCRMSCGRTLPQDHRDLARAVHSMLIGDHPPKPVPPGARAPETSYGIGFIGYEEERREKMLKFEIQEALLALGYEIGEIDGIIGRGTRGAIRSFQKAQGDPADGKPSAALLDKMRKVAQSRGLSRPAPAP